MRRGAARAFIRLNVMKSFAVCPGVKTGPVISREEEKKRKKKKNRIFSSCTMVRLVSREKKNKFREILTLYLLSFIRLNRLEIFLVND